MKKHITSKSILTVFMYLLTISIVQASSLVCGRIYLKGGTIIECSKEDRLKLPRRSRSTIFMQNAYSKDEVRKTFKITQIDSIIAWHPATPEHLRKFIPSKRFGWLWIYFETPQICVGVYSTKGYGIDTNGGIQIMQRKGFIFRSKATYCLKKMEAEDFESVGKINGKANGKFRNKVAEYVNDDPNLAETILYSKTKRDKTILILQSYKSSK